MEYSNYRFSLFVVLVLFVFFFSFSIYRERLVGSVEIDLPELIQNCSAVATSPPTMEDSLSNLELSGSQKLAHEPDYTEDPRTNFQLVASESGWAVLDTPLQIGQGRSSAMSSQNRRASVRFTGPSKAPVQNSFVNILSSDDPKEDSSNIQLRIDIKMFKRKGLEVHQCVWRPRCDFQPVWCLIERIKPRV